MKNMNVQQIETNGLGRINLAYITSLRETIGDEMVGKEVTDPDTGISLGYREGNLENLAWRVRENHNPIGSNFNLVAVMADDEREEAHRLLQLGGWKPNIAVPVRDYEGNELHTATLEEMLHVLPSKPWRSIKGNTVFKEITKEHFETGMADFLDEREVDIVISDSYLCLFDTVMLERFGGRIINIHPAITQKESPYRLPGASPTRDAFTRAKYGFVIVDDKKDRSTWPEGEVVQVEYEGSARDAIPVPKFAISGVTVHVVTSKLDAGPVILDRQYDFDPETTTAEMIRNRNYEIKRDLLPQALLEYVGRPNVQQLIRNGREARQFSSMVRYS